MIVPNKKRSIFHGKWTIQDPNLADPLCSMTWIVRKDLNDLGNGRSVNQWNLMQLLPLCNNTMVVEWINNDNHY